MQFPTRSGAWQPQALQRDLTAAAQLLTRLPLSGWNAVSSDGSASHPARFYPVIGLGIGALAGAVFALASWLALPPIAAALAALAASILATGALHEDGLADVADGFGGGRDREAKLAIMRDSRIGSYGVLALILVTAARGGSLTDLAAPGLAAAALIAAHSLSRAGLTAMMWLQANARRDGLAAATGRPGAADALTAVLIAVAAAMLLLDLRVALTAVLACAVAQACLALAAQRQIGGITGDVLGAAQQLGEAAILLVACAGAMA